jgi:hypothetical protein
VQLKQKAEASKLGKRTHTMNGDMNKKQKIYKKLKIEENNHDTSMVSNENIKENETEPCSKPKINKRTNSKSNKPNKLTFYQNIISTVRNKLLSKMQPSIKIETNKIEEERKSSCSSPMPSLTSRCTSPSSNISRKLSISSNSYRSVSSQILPVKATKISIPAVSGTSSTTTTTTTTTSTTSSTSASYPIYLQQYTPSNIPNHFNNSFPISFPPYPCYSSPIQDISSYQTLISPNIPNQFTLQQQFQQFQSQLQFQTELQNQLSLQMQYHMQMSPFNIFPFIC